MSQATTSQPRVSPSGLIDEVMGVLMRGESSLFADLAQAAWQPQATLGSLTGSAMPDRKTTQQRDAA